VPVCHKFDDEVLRVLFPRQGKLQSVWIEYQNARVRKTCLNMIGLFGVTKKISVTASCSEREVMVKCIRYRLHFLRWVLTLQMFNIKTKKVLELSKNYLDSFLNGNCN